MEIELKKRKEKFKSNSYFINIVHLLHLYVYKLFLNFYMHFLA
jgi:hypothetical protein